METDFSVLRRDFPLATSRRTFRRGLLFAKIPGRTAPTDAVTSRIENFFGLDVSSCKAIFALECAFLAEIHGARAKIQSAVAGSFRAFAL